MAKKHHRPSKNFVPAAESVNTSHPFKYILTVAFLILSTVVVYYPSLKVPFLLDDYGKIIVNPDIKSVSHLPSRLIYPYGRPLNFHRNDPSRPLTYLTLTLNYAFSQLNPYGYHVINIAIHMAVVFLVYLLGLLLFRRRGIMDFAPPFFAALLFAVLPINVNVVSYVMGRAASLATIFYAAAVILFILWRQNVKWSIALSVLMFVPALAANQLAVTLPAIIWLTDFCFFREATNKKVHIVYWGILGFYLALRVAYFGRMGDLEAIVPVFHTREYILTEWVVLWKYAGMVFVPKGLSFEHLYGPITRFSDPHLEIATGLYAVLCIGFLRGLKKSWAITSFILFGVVWFLITLSPTSSVLATTATMAENRVYLPAIGLCVIAPFIMYWLLDQLKLEQFRTPLFLTIFGIYITLLGHVTFQRNMLYQNPMEIWKDVIQRYPDHARAHQNLAVLYLNQKQYNQAIEECKNALATAPGNLDVRNNLAAAYYDLGRYKDSLETYKEIINENPNYAAAYNNIGLVDEQLGNVDEAMGAYQKAVALNPILLEPYNNLGNIYLQKGRIHNAIDMYQSALKIDPHNTILLSNYQKALNMNQKP